MLAMNYRGPYRVRVSTKPDPVVEHSNDAIVQVLRACICGSDLHLHHGLVPDTRVGTTFGHEFVGPTPIPDELLLEDAVMLTDSFPTGYQAAEMGGIRQGDTAVVFGAGPVGVFAAKSAWLMGAGRVIVVDHLAYRLAFVRGAGQGQRRGRRGSVVKL